MSETCIEENDKKQESENQNEYWDKELKKWEKSGKTQAAYCRDKKLSPHVFSYWKKKRIPNKATSFVKLSIPPIPEVIMAPTSDLTLTVDKRFTIDIKDQFNPVTLKAVIKTLGGL